MGGEISSTLKTEEKSERDAKLHERLETKLRKLNAARSHNQRLLTKEGGQAGLSDGQRKAFDSNDERIKKLTDEILTWKIRSEEETNKGTSREGGNEDDSYLYAKQRDEEPEEEVMRDLTTPLARARTAEEKAARRNRRFMTAAPAAAPPPPDEEDGMTYEMLREKRDRVDAALLKLREGPSLSTREARRCPRRLHAANDEQEASDVAAAAARDTAALEKERARLTVLMDFARPALEGLSSKATPAAVAPPPEPLLCAGSARTGGRAGGGAAAAEAAGAAKNLKRRRPWHRRCRARPTLRTRNPQNAARRRSAASWARRAGPRRPPRRARSRAATSTGRRPWGRTGGRTALNDTGSGIKFLLLLYLARRRSDVDILFPDAFTPRKISAGGRHGEPSPSAVSVPSPPPCPWREGRCRRRASRPSPLSLKARAKVGRVDPTSSAYKSLPSGEFAFE